MRVSLSNMPDPPREYVVDFPRLDGGLNIWELDYRLDSNQSPDMKNMMWRDGALSCRDGQAFYSAAPEVPLGTGYACYSVLFWDHAFFHIDDKIYCLRIVQDGPLETEELVALCEGVPENRGTFFRYGDALYYKNRGGYYEIRYSAEGAFSCVPVVAYSPITYINMEPTTHAGDEYQPENRLCPQKTVWYSVVQGVTAYHLPAQDIESVDRVVVDDVELEEGAGYTVDLAAGTVTFDVEPAYHNPYVANTVKITYTKENLDAYNSIMDCPYAEVYGGDQNVCVVLGGCSAQPNAYFWNGNHIVMDAGYFPFEQYNFAGDTEEYITGFGKQQSMLVIFKERSVGRAVMSTVEMESGRVLIQMPYTNINSRVGCDLPWSIQLIENNLVFCNTEQGVHFIKDSSSAYENNVVPISRNVDGSARRTGLLAAVRGAENVASFDDDSRYWVVADGKTYAWDYTLSTYSEPSWFYFENIRGVAFFKHNDTSYHLNALGRVSVFQRRFVDYTEPIEKVYQFATQYMGGYDRKKDILSVLLACRSDTDTEINVTYLTDYETRQDLTPIRAYSWKLAPRNLAHRFLGGHRYAIVARRKPGCRHIRHFSMRLENAALGTDMSIVSAQIFYRYQGRER